MTQGVVTAQVEFLNAPNLDFFVTGDRLTVAADGSRLLVGRITESGVADLDPGPGSQLFDVPRGATALIRLDAEGRFVRALPIAAPAGVPQPGVEVAGSADGSFALFGAFRGSLDLDLRPGVESFRDAGNQGVRRFLSTHGPDGALRGFRWLPDDVLGFDGSRFDPTGLRFLPSGELLMVADLFGTVEFATGEGPVELGEDGQDGMAVLRFDRAGRLLTAGQIMGTKGSGRLEPMAVGTSGDVVLTVTLQSSDAVDIDPGPGVVNVSTRQDERYLIRLDATGAYSWSLPVPGDERSLILGSLAIDGVGQVYVSARFLGRADADFGTGEALLTSRGGTGVYDAYVATYRPDGSFRRAVPLVGPGLDNPLLLADDRAGLVVATTFGRRLEVGAGGLAGTIRGGARSRAVFRLDDGGAVESAFVADDLSLPLATEGARGLVLIGSREVDEGSFVPTLLDAEARPLPVGGVPGDYDFDGMADLALYQDLTLLQGGSFGEASIRPSATRDSLVEEFPMSPGSRMAPIPVSGDFDGDGRTDVAIVEPSFDADGDSIADYARWIIEDSSTGQRRIIPFGAPTQIDPFNTQGPLDRPAPADYDGDGTTDIATFRANSDLTPGAAEWFILLSSGPALRVAFGAAGGLDLPAVADYDGDGKADIATFRPKSDLVPGASQWFVLPSGPNPGYATKVDAFSVVFGAGGNADQPVPADYDGDGKADIAAFRSESDLPDAVGQADWFILPSRPNPGYRTALGGYRKTFGSAGDVAAVADYDADGRPDFAVYNPGSNDWTIDRSTDGRTTIKFKSRFTVTGPSGRAASVPIEAPLFFRLFTRFVPD